MCHRTLGLELHFADHANFWPKCPESPAFLKSGDSQVAMLPTSVPPVENHTEAHVAFGLENTEWEHARIELPELLKAH